MWSFILYFVLPPVALYAFTATIFLFLVQLEKNADGKLVLDPDSWHFKVAYPFARYKVKDALEKRMSTDAYKRDRAKNFLASYQHGLCVYFFKFFLMFYLGYPILVVFSFLCHIVANVCAISFGYCVFLSFDDRFYHWKYPLPRVYGIRLLPIYFLVPLLYAALWYAYPDDTPVKTGYAALAFGAIIAIVAILWATATAVVWLGRTDKESVSMVREWISAKKQGICPLTEIKISDDV
ncbi:MAG: hypothetical protein HYS73_00135 [Parcubacteria group bacterium]|nr:hypothetical protein [Parcubacteria group bacterium]